MCMNMCIIMCMNMCMYMVAIKRSELAPDFDVVGIEIQMLDKDCVDVAADGGVTVAEDAGDDLLPISEGLKAGDASSALPA